MPLKPEDKRLLEEVRAAIQADGRSSLALSKTYGLAKNTWEGISKGDFPKRLTGDKRTFWRTWLGARQSPKVNVPRGTSDRSNVDANGRVDLLTEYQRITELPIEEWRKDLKVAALEALTRAEAMAADARAREADARAADQRARSARVAALSELARTRFLRRVEDAAIREAARLRELERLQRLDEGTDRSDTDVG